MFAYQKPLFSLGVVACSVIVPQHVFASQENLQLKMERLNAQDAKCVVTKKIDELSKWKALEKNKKFINACHTGSFSPILLNEFYFISKFYKKPLCAEHKIHLRKVLIDLYIHTQNDDEKEYILDIINYFGLLTEVF
jgi:hypothetical protein